VNPGGFTAGHRQRWHLENEMEIGTQTKSRKWFRRPWFKILTFIFVTPVWILIVWLDPDERNGIKVFAGVVLALGIAVTVFQHFGPEAQARKALQREWEESDSASRLEMLTHSASHSAFDLLGDATREEVIAMLGSPEETPDNGSLVYRHGALTCTLQFDDAGKLNGMRTQGQMTTE